MGKVKGKHRLDKYYHLAKEHGYRSRASWKLVQLDAKFGFLRSSRAVLDLCAAPGGWMQVAVQRVPVGSLVVGLDLVPIAPIRGAAALQQDITRIDECRAKVKKVMSESGATAFDLILHDGSPNVGGAWAQEAMSQNALVIDAVKLATNLLAPKGTFITKVFRSQDYESVKYCLSRLFEKVEVHKPAASRSTSAETYLLAFKYKAAAKIDPRILDVKFLFQGAIEPPRKVIDVLRGTKQKRFREGYEDGDTTLRKVSTVADFIWSDTPLDILGSVTSLRFDDPASVPIQENALTTEEVKILCDDLRVLGKQDFRHLLKWRMHIRKALTPSEKPEAASSDKDAENENKVDEEEKILNEMEELTHAMERKQKRKKKIIAKRRAKEKTRKATGMQDGLDDSYVDRDLFSLSAIKGKKDLVAVDSTEDFEENVVVSDSDNEELHDKTEEELSSDADSDEERKRYNKQMEEYMDQAYDQYMSKRVGSSKQRKRAKRLHSDDILEGGGDDEATELDNDSDTDVADQEANPLMIPFNDGEGPTQEEITNKWFSQDIFAEAVDDGDLQRFDSDDEMQLEELEKKKKPNAPEKKPSVTPDEKTRQTASSNKSDDFEIVPAPETDSSDGSSSDESDMDDYTKAEILACAKKMLRKKERNRILDDAYNKYMFDDEGLPKWFLDEESKHRQPAKPVTKEEIAAIKAQFKDINARPAKKVAEAKARKKRVAMRKLEKVRKKANVISDQNDISDQSKRRQIEKLYSKATSTKRPKKEYVVAKKGVQVKVGPGKVLVDPRMKKEARAKKRLDSKGKGKGKSKSKGNSGKADSKKGQNRKFSKSQGPPDSSGKRGKMGNRGKKMGRRG